MLLAAPYTKLFTVLLLSIFDNRLFNLDIQIQTQFEFGENFKNINIFINHKF